MKLKSVFLYIILFLITLPGYSRTSVFTGRVTDAGTGEPLPGASVSIPDLGISEITDGNGNFAFRNAPNKGHFLVEVKYIGYKVLTKNIDFSSPEPMKFALQPTAIEAHEVVVTGTAVSANSRQNSTSVTSLNKSQLLAHSTNLIDAVAKVPGVSQISTGPAISKPVIRGLGYNRVVTVDNGVKQEGQQWGDEHGIEIDQYKADRVEVLRGAASLMYGSDALGGVINLLEPLTAPEGQIKGEVLSNYATNNGLTGNSLMLTGNENGLVWRARGSYKNAYSFKTPTGYFPNSGFNETDLSGMIGLNKKWGYSHLNFSSFRNNIGFYDPEFDPDGNYVNEEGIPFTGTDFKGRHPEYPKQDIRHYKINLNNNIIIGSGYLKADLAFQKNERRELEDGPNPGLFFDLDTYTADLKYYLHENNGWQPVFGFSTEAGHSQNKGTEFLVPDYDTYGTGVFAYIKKTWNNSTVNGGLRYDYRKNTGKELVQNNEQVFSAFTNRSSNISGALGYTHQFSDFLNFKANAGTAFRSPNPAELGSNGVHEGTFRYETGNPDLKPERSYQADATLEYNSNTISGSIGIYNNYIHDYIYASNTKGDNTVVTGEDGDTDTYPVYRYGQVNANLYGAEASLTIHPVPFIHFENTFGYTYAENITLRKPLPFIPAGNLRNELRFEPKIKDIQDPYFSIGISNFFRQYRVDNEFETPTSGYTLLNAGIGATVMLKNQPLKLYVSGDNLLNKKYYNALSRLKPGRLDQTDPTLGVYDPGRNISFGIYIPFTVKK